ncbi:MAG: hypothetical protein WC807_12370 [Hyphomicrobium sp.]|jgi:hypothetical protein
MLKRFAAFTLVVSGLGGTAFAGDVPATADECFKTSITLAKEAEGKKLSDDKLAKIEDLLTKIETHCEAKQFAEASAVGKDVKALISGQ